MTKHYKEVTEAFYEIISPTNLFNIVIVTILLVNFWGSSAQQATVTWAVLLVLVLATRQVLAYCFKRRSPVDPLKWLRAGQLITLFSGTIWGFLALSVFPSDVPGGEFFIIIVFVGMSATASVTYSMSPLAYWLFIGPVLISLSIRLLLFPAYSFRSAWWLALLYLAFLLLVNRTGYNQFIKTLDLKKEKDDLIEELKDAKEESESAFETMEAVAEEARAIAVRAQSADKAKSDFLANISHEIRTPLNHIIGLTNLVLESDLDEDNEEFLQTMLQSSNSLIEMVNNIIEFSKLEEHQESSSRHRTSIGTLINEVLTSKQSLLEGKRLKIEVEVGPEIPMVVSVDVRKLKLVLNALIDNAIKFTSDGSIHIQANVREKIDDHLLILFSIQDTGIGIPANLRDRVFDSFYQIDATSTRKHGGTGIGLALARGLTGFLGGSIWVESEEGVGSSFYFTAKVWPSNLDDDDE